MGYLSPPTLTADEQKLIPRATAVNPRDLVIFSLALGTGLRLAEMVSSNVGDVFAAAGTPRNESVSAPRSRREDVQRTCSCRTGW